LGDLLKERAEKFGSLWGKKDVYITGPRSRVGEIKKNIKKNRNAPRGGGSNANVPISGEWEFAVT